MGRAAYSAIPFMVAITLGFSHHALSKTELKVCLSKQEARHLWPRQHIYWYSKDHCWSNRRGPPRGLHIDPLPSTGKPVAEGESTSPPVPLPVPSRFKHYPPPDEARAEEPADFCCWPPLLSLIPNFNLKDILKGSVK